MNNLNILIGSKLWTADLEEGMRRGSPAGSARVTPPKITISLENKTVSSTLFFPNLDNYISGDFPISPRWLRYQLVSYPNSNSK